MKQWELRGVTVDRRGFARTPSSNPSSARGRPAVTRRTGVENAPRPDPSDEEVPTSER
jgi:hypothetical protein